MAALAAAYGNQRSWLIRSMILSALVFSPALFNEFVFDDWDQIVSNRYIGNWAFVWKSFVNDVVWFRNPLNLPQSAFYRPFHSVWLAVNFFLFGPHPMGWHAAAIVLHLTVVWLAFRVSTRLAGDAWTGLIAATLFALIPIHAETVSYAAAVAPMIAAAFEFGAFDLYLRCRLDVEGAQSRSKWNSVALALFGCALLSYESAAVFPLLVAAHTFIFSRDAGDAELPVADRGSKAAAAAWPYAVILAIYLGLRLRVLGFLSQPHPLNSPTWPEAVLTIPAAIAADLKLLALPWLAAPTHSLEFTNRVWSVGFILPLLELSILTAAGFFALRRHPHRRLYLFCALWFAIAISPTLNLRALFSQAAIQDRYLYFASFGFCVMAADLAASYARAGELQARYAAIGTAAVGLIYATILLSVERYWHDDVALFSRCVEESPDDWIWHNALGVTLAGRGEYLKARTELDRANSLQPDQVGNLYYLALVDKRLGDLQSAEAATAARLKLVKHPSAAAYAELALIADSAGDKAGTEAALKQAAAMTGGPEIASLARAELKFRHGDTKGAVQETSGLIAHPSSDPDQRISLAMELMSEHRYAEALDAFKRAAALRPGDAGLHYRIASTLHSLGRDSEARDECALALAKLPNDLDAISLMAELKRGGAPQ
ncbi:MAG TPA: tetratricopeptide repeat protein [Candidatus Binataceae bacterium]|nr:tetratricopeptide repeat protein [Candidatus Binataceae bacterium]